MKIYQIHEYGGEWEDRYDYILGSYLSKEKAITEKERLEKEEEQVRKCQKCYRQYLSENKSVDREYCNRCEPFNKDIHEGALDDYDDEGCIHYFFSFHDSHFKIEEVEVIE